MLNLKDKLNESLLDDEDDLINSGDLATIFNKYNIDGNFEIKEKSGKIYIENIHGFPLRNNTEYISSNKEIILKMIEVSKFIFNNADAFGNEIERCDRLNIQDDTTANVIGCDSKIKFNNVDGLYINCLGKSKNSIQNKIVKNIHLQNIGTVQLSVHHSEQVKWVGKLLENTKISDLSLMNSYTLDFLSDFKNMEIDTVIIKGSLIFNSDSVKTYIPDLFIDLFDDFLKNNKIGKIIIHSSRPKKVKKDNGIFMNKSTFELVKVKDRYKLV